MVYVCVIIVLTIVLSISQHLRYTKTIKNSSLSEAKIIKNLFHHGEYGIKYYPLVRIVIDKETVEIELSEMQQSYEFTIGDEIDVLVFKNKYNKWSAGHVEGLKSAYYISYLFKLFIIVGVIISL